MTDTDPDRRRERDRLRQERRWADAHAGHDVALQRRTRPDGQPYRWCRTCNETYDIDPIAIERAVAGDPPGRLNPLERRAAVAQLRPQLSAARIAQRLRVTDRTIWRDIAANRTTTED